MVSLKQLEAFDSIARLGTFERAAARLHTSQSAVSKRIQELEASLGLSLLDRSHRRARLTDDGEQVLALGKQMLHLRQQMVDLREGHQAPLRRLRLGVTEMSALSWLPRLVTAIRKTHPTLILEPEVEMSRVLYERLLDGTTDLIIIPEAFSDPEISSTHVADVSNVWTARRGTLALGRPLTPLDLAGQTILTQSGRSGSSLLINKWLRGNGISFKGEIVCDSLTALVGLVAAGVGITYLPRHCVPSFRDEEIEILPVEPALPPVPYVAMYRNDRPSTFFSAIAQLTHDVCQLD